MGAAGYHRPAPSPAQTPAHPGPRPWHTVPRHTRIPSHGIPCPPPPPPEAKKKFMYLKFAPILGLSNNFPFFPDENFL